jgi:putative inorganic carbon (HCO3(-)) transporter
VSAELARVAGPVGAAGLVVLMLSTARWQRLTGLVVWALGVAVLATYLAPKGHAALLGAAAATGLVVAAVGAYSLRRWPWLLALATLACVPARIPVTIGSTQANLLVPLYGVVAAAALALAWDFLRGDERSRELGPVALPLAAFVAWTGLSLAWSHDVRQGAIELLAFYLPFGLLAVSLSRLDWRAGWVAALYAELCVMAPIFAVVGIEQWITRDIFWNPKLLVGNTYAPFYRVNSVFWDPSIYGRFLVVAILATLVVALRSRSWRTILAAAAGIALVWVGLLFSFSQSSFAALIAGVVLAAIFAWGRRAIALIVVGAVVFVLAAAAAPNVRHAVLHHTKGGANRVTSGRSKLVTNGVKIAEHHPVVGVGVGGFKHAYAKQAHLRSKEPKAGASHDTPITVAAETGIPGLALLTWLVVAGLALAFRRRNGDLAGTTALACGLLFAAIGVHSLFYNAFFEDPTVWGVLALAAVTARVPLPGSDERPEPPQLDRQVEAEREQDQRVDGRQRHSAGQRHAERLPEHG